MNRKEFIQSTFLASFAATIPISAFGHIFAFEPKKRKFTTYPCTGENGIFIFDLNNKLLAESQTGAIRSDPVWDFIPVGDIHVYQPSYERKLRHMETEIEMQGAETYIPLDKLLDDEMLKIVMAKDGVRFIADIFITEVGYPSRIRQLVNLRAKVYGAITTIIDDLI